MLAMRSVKSSGDRQAFLSAPRNACPSTSKFQECLLNWFRAHRRKLPWRAKADPYRIFVVEVMLQQTQIKTVIPYYERWMKTFPNVKVLARAPLDRVLKLWEGLGYYSRARNLHKAARIIVKKFGGKIPQKLDELQSLPGIGRYTAGAIASIAHGKQVSLVDGNVLRVLARLFNLKDDISRPETIKKFYRIADSLVPEKTPGQFNQAMMELGSLICTSEFPDCPNCPVARFCEARQKGDPLKLPVRGGRTQVKKIEMMVGLLSKNGRVLVRRRPEHGIWGGLWELPGTIRKKGVSREEALRHEFHKTLGIPINIQKKETPIMHRFTHREAVIYPYRLSARRNGKLNSRAVRWADPLLIKHLSFPVPHQKILRSFHFH